MEQAVYFSNIKTLRSRHPGFKQGRVYFGNEFCDELIPSPEDLKEALSIVLGDNKRFTLMTCYVSEHKIRRYWCLLETLAQTIPAGEVVINDWGLLAVCLENGLTPVLGRLLTRQKRDPRIVDFVQKVVSPARCRLQQMGLNDATIDFLKQHRIHRIELDNLSQGIDPGQIRDSGMSYSVYVPFGYVTTSRICFFRNKDRERGEKFMIGPCAAACRGGRILRLRNKQMQPFLFMKGNTVFAKNPRKPFFGPGQSVDRLVYEPVLPE